MLPPTQSVVASCQDLGKNTASKCYHRYASWCRSCHGHTMSVATCGFRSKPSLMRAPQRRRPQKRVTDAPSDVDLDEVASRTMYVGSPEHSSIPGLGLPRRWRPDATRCPPEITDKELVLEWLRSAIRRGAVSEYWEPNQQIGFPRYVWHKEGDTVYEARLVNRGDGSYKGYPITDDEWPKGIEDIYAET